VIFEDTDGDGKFDTKKVFADKLSNVSGLAVGHGGVWLTALPYVLFIPDRNGDDVPDGPAEILLDGWDMKAKHNVFNKPSWGPDGWLYGLNGILSNSKVGKPGTPDAERIPLNCGVWRLHPVTRKFEVVCTGTTNPWGIDWDEFGRGFITNCVIKHVFQVIPGAHYDRMFGEDKSAPNLYGLIPSCADHIHWAGGAWQDARGQDKHSEAGGGHAHVGAMVYLGDNWPDSYRGHLFTMNLHGHRMSHDVFEPKGSGVVADAREGLPDGQRPVVPRPRLPIWSRRRRVRHRLDRHRRVPQLRQGRPDQRPDLQDHLWRCQADEDRPRGQNRRRAGVAAGFCRKQERVVRPSCAATPSGAGDRGKTGSRGPLSSPSSDSRGERSPRGSETAVGLPRHRGVGRSGSAGLPGQPLGASPGVDRHPGARRRPRLRKGAGKTRGAGKERSFARRPPGPRLRPSAAAVGRPDRHRGSAP